MKYNTGVGVEQKKVNPLKVLGIIALIILAVGIIIYATHYDYYENLYSNNNDQNTVENGSGEEETTNENNSSSEGQNE